MKTDVCVPDRSDLSQLITQANIVAHHELQVLPVCGVYRDVKEDILISSWMVHSPFCMASQIEAGISILKCSV